MVHLGGRARKGFKCPKNLFTRFMIDSLAKLYNEFHRPRLFQVTNLAPKMDSLVWIYILTKSKDEGASLAEPPESAESAELPESAELLAGKIGEQIFIGIVLACPPNGFGIGNRYTLHNLGVVNSY